MKHVSQIRIRISDHDCEVSFTADDINHVTTAPNLTRRLTQMLDERFGDDHEADILLGGGPMAAVRMDLGQLSSLSSAGLNELINMNRKSKSRGARFVLENVQESLRGIFALTRLERMFEFEEHGAEVGVE